MSPKSTILACLVLLVGCANASPDESNEILNDEAVSSSEALTGFRCDATDDVSHAGSGQGGGSLRAVRVAAHPEAGFDRFVMEFESHISPDAYLVTRNGGTVFYGTGENETKVKGQDGIAVIFQNGQMESSYQGPRRMTLANAKGIKEVAEYDQFEGNIEWALGTQANPCWRTSTLQNPPRLIVDVKR